MLQEKPKWYSGKYDSVKQYIVLKHYLTGNYSQEQNSNLLTPSEEQMYRRYITSMRVEMVYAGKIVVTDAQWYDGRIFSLMCKIPNEFSDFTKAMTINKEENQYLFEIKRRPDHIYNMRRKKFEYSSLTPLTSKNLSESHFSDLMNHSGPNLSIESGITYSQYLKVLKQYIEKDEDPNCISYYNQFAERLQLLEGIDEGFYSEWENNNALPTLFNTSPSGTGQSYREMLLQRINDWGNEHETAEKKVINECCINIRSALESNFPNRSIIKENVDRIQKIEDDAKPKYKEFMSFFDLVYNNGIAKQHNCCNNDAAGYNKGIDREKEKKELELEIIEIPPVVFETIGACSWDEFISIVTKEDDFPAKREQWLMDYKNYCEKPTNDLKEIAHRSLMELANTFISHFTSIKKDIVNRSYLYGIDSMHLYDRERMHRMPLIGGTCNDDQIEANDVSIFFPNMNSKRGQLIVLCTEKNDTVVDTLINPGQAMLEKLID